MAQTYWNAIPVGARVISYDFPGCTDHYITGTVIAIRPWADGTRRYEIEVDGAVPAGNAPDYVYPPVNGTPRLGGGVCDGVCLLE